MPPLLRLLFLFLLAVGSASAAEGPLTFPAQRRGPGPHGEAVQLAEKAWEPAATAIVLCDFWDSHTCSRAVRRVQQLAPRVAAVVDAARDRGVLVIHAPSDCMDFYKDHPARRRATEAPRAADLPDGITQWMKRLDAAEEKAGDPIDSSDGGNDDTPEEKTAWRAVLAREGRLAGPWPWRRQHPSVRIDPDKDIVSDRGDEIWNVLRARGIRHVFVAGVHTNMCVCGRPFGIRRLVAGGLEVVLLRDLTDTMYNPAQPPRASHVHGTALMVAHIERHLCATAPSGAVFGGSTPPFAEDDRVPLAVLTGEPEYFTAQTLTGFLERDCGGRFRVSWVAAPDGKSGSLLQSEALDEAAVLLVSMRRTALAAPVMERLRRAVARGAAVVGIRTGSHAFAPRDSVPPDAVAWPEWDREILGGNYQGHHGADARVTVAAPAVAHPILQGLPAAPFASGGSLYRNTPLAEGTTVLLTAAADGIAQPEPVAWTFLTPSGGRVFCTSLGHPDDFAAAPFRQLLRNALQWAAGGSVPAGGVPPAVQIR